MLRMELLVYALAGMFAALAGIMYVAGWMQLNQLWARVGS